MLILEVIFVLHGATESLSTPPPRATCSVATRSGITAPTLSDTIKSKRIVITQAQVTPKQAVN